ncbi:MAG: KpsF/GutQ family sugar-phosphate isomerase [Planctomycetales bacterium]|nr:KpsF/GutQ family sugar-phosphate isomerase [Planctomycetales bacterium]
MSRDAAAPLRQFEAASPTPLASTDEILSHGREVIQAEAAALAAIALQLDGAFADAVRLLCKLRGSLIVTGIGKAGHIGAKLTATFASVGTRAHFLHPAEAFHGDLGRVHADDAVLVLSQSGETSEVLQLLPALRSAGVTIIALTAHHGSTLARAADLVLPLGRLEEACSLGLAPSTSTAVMLALGDALALTVSRLQGFRAEDFARYHPGGALGLKLSAVDDHMRTLDECRVSQDWLTIREVLVSCTRPGRRSGAIMLVDREERLSGLFTDSDLARLIERRDDAALDAPIGVVMVHGPATVTTGDRMTAALDILASRKFSELPVVDRQRRPLGMIDVTDVVGMLPEQKETDADHRFADDGPPIVRLYPEALEFDFEWGDELPETD